EAVNQEEGNIVERAITTDASLEAAQDSDNIIKTQTMTIPNVDIPQGIDTDGSLRRQKTIGEGHTSGSGEDRLEENVELTDTVPTPHDSPLSGELAKEGARQKQERYNLEKALELQRQLDQRKNCIPKGDQAKEIDWNDPQVLRYHAIQNRPFSKAKDQVHTFVPKDSEIKREVMKRAEFDLQQGSSKKQRLDQQTEETKKEAGAQGDSDQEVEELKLYMRITPEEGIAIKAIPLATKPLVIIEYKMVKEGNISTYHITRAGGSIKRYTPMINLLENIDREDLETLWKLVKDKYRNTRPEEGYKRVLWGDLKVMFEPDIECEVWRRLQGHDVIV
nr:hypothetical protein [Tanacetum cinerariifolium]